MRYIDKWLSGLGLDYVIPKLEANGITTPKKLAQLTLRDMFEVVGVENPEDRKKLYFLIQRLQSILNKTDGDNPDEEAVREIESHTKQVHQKNDHEEVRVDNEIKKWNERSASAANEEDLRSLRKKYKDGENGIASPSEDPSPRYRSASNTVHNSAKETHNSHIDSDRRTSKIPTPRTTSTTHWSDQESAVQGRSVTGSNSQPSLKLPSKPSITGAHSNPVSSKLESRASVGSVITSKNLHGSESSPASRFVSPSKRPSTASAIEFLDAPATRNSVTASAPTSTKHANHDIDYGYQDNGYHVASSLADLPIRVVVRKRPVSKSELNRGERDVLEVLPEGKVNIHEPKTKVDLTKFVETQSFVFDDAFDCDENNDVIYTRTVKPLVNNVFQGGKATCFAYGQTGSGKTYTMMGDITSKDPTKLGLYVHAARDIFTILHKPEYASYQAYVSCFEIYGGKLFDLLHERGLVKCLEDSKQQVQILGLTEHLVPRVDALVEMMQVALNSRSTGSTGANAESSRSHLIMQIEIKKPSSASSNSAKKPSNSFQKQFKEGPPKFVSVGKLSFIDLAGSERGKDTTDNSKQTRMEGAEINTSLLALKEVIRSLNRQAGHTPFRGSKLTQVLKDSFVGENTRTCMVACVAPNHLNCEHTLNTLRYADRVKEHQVGGPSTAPTGAPGTPAVYDSPTPIDDDSAYDEPYQEPISPPPQLASRPATSAGSNSQSRPTTSPTATNQTKESVYRTPSQGGVVNRLSPQALAPFSVPSPTSQTIHEDPELESLSRGVGGVSVKDRKSMLMRKASSNSTASSVQGSSVQGSSVQGSTRHPTFSNSSSSPRDIYPPATPDDENNDIGTAVIKMTVSLLTSHKTTIAEMVEVMKEEMMLVQDMENAEDRDSEGYVDKLEQILDLKRQGLENLRKDLLAFQEYRQTQRRAMGDSINQSPTYAPKDSDQGSEYSEDNDMLSIPGSRAIQQRVIQEQLRVAKKQAITPTGQRSVMGRRAAPGKR